MIGPEGATALLVARMAAALPAKTVELRERLAIADPFDLPDIREVWYGQTSTTSIEAWPLIEVLTARTEPARFEDEDTLRVGYGLRLYLWARGTSQEQTARVRDRLTLAVMEVLTAQPGLAAGVVIRPTWAWSMSDLVRDKEAGTIGGARLDLVVDVDEALDPADDVAVPTVTVVHLDTATVPPGAPL